MMLRVDGVKGLFRGTEACKAKECEALKLKRGRDIT